MLSTTMRIGMGASAVRAVAPVSQVEHQVRCAATLKTIAIRMKSVKNIQKITKAMKMVSAAKLKGDQRRMDTGVPFSKPIQNLMARLPREETPGPITYFGVTGDKGLCGGVNSAVSKRCRIGVTDEEAKGNTAKMVMIGSKGTVMLKRLFADRFQVTFEDVVKSPWTFTTASIIADRVIASNPKRLKLISNDYISMASYNTTIKHMVTMSEAKNMDRGEWSKAMDVYSFEPALYEVWNDLHDFYFGSVIFGAYLEALVVEQSQRMAAMENATKNAGEMLDKLYTIYNRARQAKITTELCEIISGASAVS